MTDKVPQNSDTCVQSHDVDLSFSTLQTGAVLRESKTAGTAEAGDDEVRILLERAIRGIGRDRRALRVVEKRLAAAVSR